MTYLVSVIIPTFNSGPYLREAIESVLNQDYTNLEVIVVDDGSTDDSIGEISDLLSAIILIKMENNGAATARNAGILASRGEYIAFLDSDDIWKRNKLSKQISLMEEDHLDLVYCNGQEFTNNNDLGLVHFAKYQGDCYKYYVRYPTRDVLAIGPSGALIKQSLLIHSGIFDSKIPAPTEDWDFFRRYCMNAKVGFCNEVLVLRRIHENNISKKSLNSYYSGNRNSIIKMMIDDESLGFLRRRFIWARFNYTSAKGFIKNKEIKSGISSFVKIFLPILI